MPSSSSRIALNSTTSNSTADLSLAARSSSIPFSEEAEKSGVSSPSRSPGLRWKFEDTADRVKYLRTKQIHHLFEELCTALLETKPDGPLIYDFLIDYMERNEEEARERRGSSVGGRNPRDMGFGSADCAPPDSSQVSTHSDAPTSDESLSVGRPSALAKLHESIEHRRLSGDEGSDAGVAGLSETHPRPTARRRSSHYSTGGEEDETSTSPRRSHEFGERERPWWARGRVEAKEARLKAASRSHKSGNASVGAPGSCTPLGSNLPQTGAVEPQSMSARRGNRAARGLASGPRGKMNPQKPQGRPATKPFQALTEKHETSTNSAFVTSTDGGETLVAQESVTVVASLLEEPEEADEGSAVFSYFVQTLSIIHAEWLLEMP